MLVKAMAVEETGEGGGGCGHGHGHDLMSIKGQMFPCKIEKKGQYGYSVEFADYATIIYLMFSLAKAAGGILLESSFGQGMKTTMMTTNKLVRK